MGLPKILDKPAWAAEALTGRQPWGASISFFDVPRVSVRRRHMEAETFSTVLKEIYDTPLSFESWRNVLDLLKQAFDCHVVTLIETDLRTGGARFAETGVGPSVAREYFTKWHKQNIFYDKALNWRPGAAQTDQEILPRNALLHSDYYVDFLRRYDMRGFVGMTIVNDRAQRLGISLLRPPPHDDFDPETLRWAAKLMPHLQNAARIGRRLAEASLEASAPPALLDLNPIGVVLLNHGGVVFANRAARAITAEQDGLNLRRGKIEAERSADNAKLQALIAGALGDRSVVEASRGGAMRLPRRSGERDYVLTIGAIPLASQRFGDTGSMAFVLVSDGRTTSATPTGVLRELYGLTAAETKLAELLATGESLEAAAQHLSIRTSTAKWHLHSLFQKVGVSRQSELVRLLLSLPWAGGDRGA
jgi:DNA-binding CsgD family transcriptional regulator